jgi:hypothetical protein
MELGFIGAHSDIGGGYGDGDLSDVAFFWMMERARSAGVAVDTNLIANKGWNKVTSPVLHDSVGVAPFWRAGRQFKYLNDQEQIAQKEWTGYGMSFATASDFYNNRYLRIGTAGIIKGWDSEGNRSLVGTVEGEYSRWLMDNYGLDIKIDETGLRRDGWPNPVNP